MRKKRVSVHPNSRLRGLRILSSLKRRVAEVFKDILASNYRPFIEFLVPRTLISHPFDEIAVDPHADEEFLGLSELKPLSYHARVVVRFWERAQNTPPLLGKALLDQWKMRSSRFFRDLASNYNMHVAWAEDIENTRDELGKPGNDNKCCLGVKFVPDSADPQSDFAETKFATMLLLRGVPIAAWVRKEPQEGLQRVHSTLEQLLLCTEGCQVHDIRDRLQELKIEATKKEYRQNPHVGSGIVLLWDDPRRQLTRPAPRIPNPLG